MDNVLVFAAVQDGKVRRSSLEVLSRFRSLTDAHGAHVDAVVADPDPGRYGSTLGRYGAARAYMLKHDVFDRHLNEPVIRGIESAFRESGAGVLVFASTEAAKDVLGALGVALSASVLPDVAEIDFVDGRWIAARPVMAAKRIAHSKATRTPIVISVRSGSYDAGENPVDIELVKVPFNDEDAGRRARIRKIAEAVTEAVDLSEARIVVAAGRGVKDDEGRQLVEQLAHLLGAATGATRAVVESGMFPATCQIGQTGKVVSPELYIGIGISGAIQHVAGMVNSRTIVAINKDADAPIFDYATYGLVGDLYKIVPALISEFRAAALS